MNIYYKFEDQIFTRLDAVNKGRVVFQGHFYLKVIIRVWASALQSPFFFFFFFVSTKNGSISRMSSHFRAHNLYIKWCVILGCWCILYVISAESWNAESVLCSITSASSVPRMLVAQQVFEYVIYFQSVLSVNIRPPTSLIENSENVSI